jgi:hypothetical protein
MGRAKSYAERLFDFPSIGPLVDADARGHIQARQLAPRSRTRRCKASLRTRMGIHTFCRSGESTHGIPRMLRRSPTTTREASPIAIAALDESFFPRTLRFV